MNRSARRLARAAEKTKDPVAVRTMFGYDVPYMNRRANAASADAGSDTLARHARWACRPRAERHHDGLRRTDLPVRPGRGLRADVSPHQPPDRPFRSGLGHRARPAGGALLASAGTALGGAGAEAGPGNPRHHRRALGEPGRTGVDRRDSPADGAAGRVGPRSGQINPGGIPCDQSHHARWTF